MVSLAGELSPEIRCNSVAPGIVLAPESSTVTEDIGSLVARVPLRRSATGHEIANAVEFLLQNQYVTGHTLVVDGGLSTAA